MLATHYKNLQPFEEELNKKKWAKFKRGEMLNAVVNEI